METEWGMHEERKATDGLVPKLLPTINLQQGEFYLPFFKGVATPILTVLLENISSLVWIFLIVPVV